MNDCALWSPWRMLASRRLINQDRLVQREIFIATWIQFTSSGSPCCDSFSGMFPQERISHSCGSISVFFAGMKVHRASWMKQDQRILFPFSRNSSQSFKRTNVQYSGCPRRQSSACSQLLSHRVVPLCLRGETGNPC